MTDTVMDIKHWGNSLGVRLPAKIARAAHLQADQQVRLWVEEGRIIIEPLGHLPMTLAQRLAHFDASRHGGEAMACAPQGAEQW